MFLILIAVGIFSTTVFTLVTTSTHYTYAIDQRRAQLKNQGEVIVNSIITSGYLSPSAVDEAARNNVDTQITLLADIYDGRVIIANAQSSIVRDTYALEQGKTLISAEALEGLKGQSSYYVNTAKEYMELILPIQDSADGSIDGIMIMSFSVKDIFALQSSLSQRCNLITAAILFVLLALATIVSVKMMRPFREITESMDRLSEGYLEDNVTIHGFTELKKISAAFNKMAKKISSIETTRDQFASDVSHELKTPMTSMKILADSLLSDPNTPAETYREFMTDITSEIDRENKIINDLLSIVRMNPRSGKLTVAMVNVNQLIEGILKQIRPIAGAREIELVFESYCEVEAEIDEVKLSFAISNLIENAVKYNNDNGWVRVTLNADHKFFFVKVEDNGVGIPEDEQERIFERFYRVDKARSRETGGTGLGLSIAKNAVLLHKGAIKVYSKLGEGTTFTMRIPLKYIP